MDIRLLLRRYNESCRVITLTSASQSESTLRTYDLCCCCFKIKCSHSLVAMVQQAWLEGRRNASCLTNFIRLLIQYYSVQKNSIDLLKTARLALCLLLPAKKRLTLTSCYKWSTASLHLPHVKNQTKTRWGNESVTSQRHSLIRSGQRQPHEGQISVVESSLTDRRHINFC